MLLSNTNIKLQQEVAFETTSLQSEGYHVICSHHWRHITYVKLRHYGNGNVIDIFGYPQDNKLTIKKNGKVIKQRENIV